MQASASVVAGLVDSDEPAYGISTGFGSLAMVRIPADSREPLQRALVRSTRPAWARRSSARSYAR